MHWEFLPLIALWICETSSATGVEQCIPQTAGMPSVQKLRKDTFATLEALGACNGSRDTKSSEQLIKSLLGDTRKNDAKAIKIITSPSSVNSSSVSYKIGDQILAPGEALFFAVPEHIRQRPVTFAILGHRQDPSLPTNKTIKKGDLDNTPGLTSVQIYSQDMKAPNSWRYWNGPASGKKGAKFAEIGFSAEIENLYEWGKYGHNSLANDGLSTEPLFADAVRVVSVGKDPVIISELMLKVLQPRADRFITEIFSKGTDLGDPLTAKDRKYGGGQDFEGTFPGALRLKPYNSAPGKLPKGWKWTGSKLHIPLEPGVTLSAVEIACGDSHPDKIINEDGGRGTKGWAKLSVGLKQNDAAHTEWFMSRENVPPEGVLTAAPQDCDYVTQVGDELVIRSDSDTTYIMALRVGIIKK